MCIRDSHDAIKTGAADRDVYVGRYIETLENLGQEDIHLVCYNFMPVFDWTRTELARLRPDGSTVLAYTQEAVDLSLIHIYPAVPEGLKAPGHQKDDQEGREDHA